MVVEDVHVLEFLSGQDFFLQQSANELVGESHKRIGYWLSDFQVNNCDFLALGVLVQSREVIYSSDLKRVLDKHTLNVLLVLLQNSRQSFSGGVMTQNEFEERQMG